MRPSKIMAKPKTLEDFVEPGEYLWLRSIVLGLRVVEPIVPDFSFRLIQRIENEIDSGIIKDDLGDGLIGKKLSNDYDRVYGAEMMDDYWRVFLSTIFARHKLLMYQVGLLSTTRKGDLRTAYAETDELKILCGLLRLESVRNNKPAWTDAILRKPWPRKDHNRLWKAAHGPALGFGDLKKNSPAEAVLLAAWATGAKFANGVSWPPFCFFTNDGLDFLFGHLYEELGHDSGFNLGGNQLRSVWQRLGLRRSDFATLHPILWPEWFTDRLTFGARPRSQKKELATFPAVPLPPL